MVRYINFILIFNVLNRVNDCFQRISKGGSIILYICLIRKRQILDSSKLKLEFADDSLKFDEYGRKFFKRVENTVVKEKLLVTSNFSFSHSVFKIFVLETRNNQGLFGKGLSFSFLFSSNEKSR